MNKTQKFAACAALGTTLVLATAGTASAQSRAIEIPGNFGTVCINEGGGAYAQGVVAGSPGVLSGNQIQIPIHIPINICGNSVNILGIG
ncbi:chaplin family protein [Kitasatospora sp. NPDC054939]